MHWVFSHVHACLYILNDFIPKTVLMGSIVIILTLQVRKLRHQVVKHRSKWAAGNLADTWVPAGRIE